MIDRHWGLNFGVKKLFATATAHATGLYSPLLGGAAPLTSTLHTYFQPWVLDTALTYRF